MVVETDPQTLGAVAFGGRSARAAERAGELTLHGDRAAFEQLLTCFGPPTAGGSHP
jgi:hypothetical protein